MSFANGGFEINITSNGTQSNLIFGKVPYDFFFKWLYKMQHLSFDASL